MRPDRGGDCGSRAVDIWQSALVGPVRTPSSRQLTRHSRVLRTRTIALALLIGTVSAALALADIFHIGLAQTAVAALVGGGSVATLYVAWATYRDDQARSETLRLSEIADQLASELGKQWNAEATARRLNDPYPLPVHWVAADAALADDWSKLRNLASSGAGWPPPASRASWAHSPAGLAGSGNELLDVLVKVPTGRLVVLGGPGAGKTVLMIRLVLDLLARRRPGGPVPVLVNLASWNPAEQDLNAWLAAQMSAERPALAFAVPSGMGGRTVIEALLADRLILPLLDGLDEIPDTVRGSAIRHINDALWPGQQLVVTCRSDAYKVVARPPGGIEVTLRGAAAIQLLPLTSNVISTYLRDDANGPVAAARWEPVIAALGTGAPVAHALETPLMVGLARIIYNPRPGERATDLRDPAELCSPALTDRAAIEQHLFDEFIPAAYRADGDAGCRWPAKKAEAWLVFLAHHLDDTLGSADLAWWQVRQAVSLGTSGLTLGLASGLGAGLGFGLAAGVAAGPTVGFAVGAAAVIAAGPAIGLISARRTPPSPPGGLRPKFRIGSLAVGLSVGLGSMLAAGLAFGLSSGISSGLMAGFRAGIGPGLSAGLAFGLAIGLATARWRLPGPSRGVRWQFSGGSLAAGVGSGLVVGLGTGLTYGLSSGPTAGIVYGPAAGLAVGAAVGLAVGLEGVPLDLTATASPIDVLGRDRRAAIVIGLGVGLGIGLGAGLGFSPLIGSLVGIAAGLGFGLIVSMLKTAWPSYTMLRSWLALRRRLPWTLMGFLDDAHRRGILRQMGMVYQFRHIELQHQLAKRR